SFRPSNLRQACSSFTIFATEPYGTCSGVRPCLDWRPRCTLTTRRVAGSRVLSDFYRYRFWLTPVASGIGQADGSVASRRHLGGVALGSAGSFDSAPY